ncbi:Hsp20/alpha crystallin family protein [Amorphus sp. 3PC139-8]|uniref:Hsp20/alpha crystallin family protein n=1 Tax=Amorphus sp. 3PC139-8 TaxID=2735676 RepID=UPI00345D9CBF
MSESEKDVPIKSEQTAPETKPSPPSAWEPFESLRREIENVFDTFGTGFWRRSARAPLSAERTWLPQMAFPVSPAVDVTEKDAAFEITVELPGLDEKDVDVSVANGVLTIKGEKKEEKEEKQKDYYLSERRYGSFQRSFPLPEGVDSDKIEAVFKKGLLSVTLPKTPEAQNNKRKIDVKSA